MLYSERILGTKPRVNEDVDPTIWKGIISILESIKAKDFFAKEFPEICPDLSSAIYGTDENKLDNTLSAYFDLSWPLIHQKTDNEWIYGDAKPYTPGTNLSFDLLEFLYSKISTPHQTNFHKFYTHYHLQFSNDNIAKFEFKNQINEFFRLKGMIYEMNDYGQIYKILNNETKLLIEKALIFKTADEQLDQMIFDACSKISHFDINVSYQALEKLWDAWERLKCIADPTDKKNSVLEIIGKFSSNKDFQNIISDEMSNVTKIGNTFRIRHSEPNQATLYHHREINYLFHRCLAIIVLIIENINCNF